MGLDAEVAAIQHTYECCRTVSIDVGRPSMGAVATVRLENWRVSFSQWPCGGLTTRCGSASASVSARADPDLGWPAEEARYTIAFSGILAVHAEAGLGRLTLTRESRDASGKDKS